MTHHQTRWLLEGPRVGDLKESLSERVRVHQAMFIAKDPTERDDEAPRPLSDLSSCGDDPACRGLTF